MELYYTGMKDGTVLYRDEGWNCTMQGCRMELYYTGMKDGTVLYRDVGWNCTIQG